MRKILTICLIMTFMMLSGVVAYATTQPTGQNNQGTDIYNTNTVNNDFVVKSNNNGTISYSDLADGGLPTVTIQQASSWAERKGNEVIGFLQTFVQPFSTIIFIICAFLTLLGAFGNSQLVGRGIFGMFIAVIMYAVILYAPEILDFILNWLRT